MGIYIHIPGTKKQAPAPPKPSNPPPHQPCNSANPPCSSSQSFSPSPRPLSNQSPTSPTPPPSQPCATPRRHSNNQPPIQAPSHPPPEPPTQPTSPGQSSGDQQIADPSPPGTPTPPDTPPPSTNTQDVAVPPSPYQSGSLPRPRPVPKPRSRPSIPPPPQPTASASDTNGICSFASKMMGEFCCLLCYYCRSEFCFSAETNLLFLTLRCGIVFPQVKDSLVRGLLLFDLFTIDTMTLLLCLLPLSHGFQPWCTVWCMSRISFSNSTISWKWNKFELGHYQCYN